MRKRKKKNDGYKLYILRTYVKARSAPEAIRKAKNMPPSDCYISDDWKEGKIAVLADAIGFEHYEEEKEEEDAEV